MPFLRKLEEQKNKAASILLAALDAHHPLPFTRYLQELEAGTPPEQVGAEIGRALSERERQCERTSQNRDYWQEQAESYRLAWESSRNSDDLGEARQRIEKLETQLTQENVLAERRSNHANYLAQEKERLETLVREQNEIIAQQQIQLSQWDENDL
ncbi:MAG: hypothetical protein HN736_15130 [Anaerolineae bacterium]|jgi:hypothetical protein|nr:hypothetical protein [Anaerolineae bacterium]MBT7776025.1 hypothetical protein [Anaerolineae bacterium]